MEESGRLEGRKKGREQILLVLDLVLLLGMGVTARLTWRPSGRRMWSFLAARWRVQGVLILEENGINPSRSGWRVTVGCLVETVGGESSSSSSLSISKHVMLAAVLLTGRVLEGGWEDEKVMGWCAEKARGWREEKVTGEIVEVMEGGEEVEEIPPHW